MRKLIDEIVWQFFMFSIKYLYRYYDIFADRVTSWLDEQFGVVLEPDSSDDSFLEE